MSEMLTDGGGSREVRADRKENGISRKEMKCPK
jgi:hypothetical protein